MLTALMASHVGALLKQQCVVMSSILVNCRGAQHATLTWPPFTFGCPIGNRLSHLGPWLKVRCAVKEICFPDKPQCGSARSCHMASVHFQPQFQAFLQLHMVGPKLLLQVTKRSKLSTLSFSSHILSSQPVAISFPSTSGL